MLDEKLSIAIDGPAGAGKSTIAKKISEILNIEYIDTGAMYRALTLKVLNLNLDPKSSSDVISTFKTTTIDFKDNHIILDGLIVDKEIRNNIINQYVSYIAKIEEVRKEMVRVQQKLAKTKSVIMDGRDIGTVVLPNADFKFFITATTDERGLRRYKELVAKGEEGIYLEKIQEEIKKRDEIDSTRKASPLIQAKDAYLLDTTHMTVDEVVKKILSIVKEG